MKGPAPPPKKKRPMTVLDILDASERHLEIRTSVRDVAQKEWGPDEFKDREIDLLSEACKIIYYVSLDPEGYRDLVRRAQNRYPRWVPIEERTAPAKEEEGGKEE